MKSALTLVLCLGLAFPDPTLAQGATATLAIPTTTRSTLESLASIGQAGLSFLNTFLNPATQASTRTPTASASSASASTASRATTTPSSAPASTTSRSSTQISRSLSSASSSAQPSSLRTVASSSNAASTSSTRSSVTAAAATNTPAATSFAGHGSRTLAIALGVSLGVLALAIIAFLLWFCRRRRRRRQRRASLDSPYSGSSFGEKSISRIDDPLLSGNRADPTPQSNLNSLLSTAPAAGPSPQSTHQTLYGAPAVAAAAAAAPVVARKPVASRNSWSSRPRRASGGMPAQRNSVPGDYNQWYDGGSSPYPMLPSQRARSWEPPPPAAAASNRTSDAAPLISPIEDHGGDDHSSSGFPQYRSYRPVSEQNPANRYYASTPRHDGYVSRPAPRPRRYSGGSAWQGAQSNQWRRSTPLSPLAQNPL